MYWLILLFRKSVIEKPGYQYWKFAIKTQQQSDILSEIIDTFVNNGFEQSTGYSDERWYNPKPTRGSSKTYFPIILVIEDVKGD